MSHRGSEDKKRASGEVPEAVDVADGSRHGFFAALSRLFGRSKKGQIAEAPTPTVTLARGARERQALEDANEGIPQGALRRDDVCARVLATYGVPQRIVGAAFDSHSRCCAVVGDDGTFDIFGYNGTQVHGTYAAAGTVPVGVFYRDKTLALFTENRARFVSPQGLPTVRPRANSEGVTRGDVSVAGAFFAARVRSCDFLAGEDCAVVGDEDGTLWGVSVRTGEISPRCVTFAQVSGKAKDAPTLLDPDVCAPGGGGGGGSGSGGGSGGGISSSSRRRRGSSFSLSTSGSGRSRAGSTSNVTSSTSSGSITSVSSVSSSTIIVPTISVSGSGAGGAGGGSGCGGSPLRLCKLNPLCPTVVLLYHARGRMLTLWDLGKGRALHRYRTEGMESITAMQWHPKGDRFFTAHQNGYVCLWRQRDEKECLWQFPMAITPRPDTPVVPITALRVAKNSETDYLFLTLGGNVCKDGDSFGDTTDPAVLLAAGPLRGRLHERSMIQQSAAGAAFLFRSNQRAAQRDPYAIMTAGDDNGALAFYSTQAPFQPLELRTVSVLFSQSPLTAATPCHTVGVGAFTSIKGPKRGTPQGTMDIMFTAHANGSIVAWDATTQGLRHLFSTRTRGDGAAATLAFDPATLTLLYTVAGKGVYAMRWCNEAVAGRTSTFDMLHFGAGDLSIAHAVMKAAAETKTPPHLDPVEAAFTPVEPQSGLQGLAAILLPEFGCTALSAHGVVAVALPPTVVALFDLATGEMHFEFVVHPGHEITALAFAEEAGRPALLLIGCDDGSAWAVSVDHTSVPLQCLTTKGWSPVVDVLVRTVESVKPAPRTGDGDDADADAAKKKHRKPASDVDAAMQEVEEAADAATSVIQVPDEADVDADADAKKKQQQAAAVDDVPSATGGEGEAEPPRLRTMVLVCMRNGVVVLEVTWTEHEGLRARDAFVSLKYHLAFASFAVVQPPDGGSEFLAAVDATMQCVAWNLYQCTEIRSMNAAAVVGIDPERQSVGVRATADGRVYVRVGAKRLCILALVPGLRRHAFQYADDVTDRDTQVSPKLNLSQRWLTSGLPLNQTASLRAFFFPRAAGNSSGSGSGSGGDQAGADASPNLRPIVVGGGGSSSAATREPQQAALSAAGELGEARQALLERREQLERTSQRSAEMTDTARSFALATQELLNSVQK